MFKLSHECYLIHSSVFFPSPWKVDQQSSLETTHWRWQKDCEELNLLLSNISHWTKHSFQLLCMREINFFILLSPWMLESLWCSGLVYSKTGSKYFPHFCSEHNLALSYGDRAGKSITGDTRDGKVASSQKLLAGIFNQSWQDLQTSGLAGSSHQQTDWKEKMSLCGFSTGETLLETLRNKRGWLRVQGEQFIHI